MRRAQRSWALLATALVPLLAGCGGYDGGANDTGLFPVTFQAPVGGLAATDEVAAFTATVFPIVREHCADCHAGSGPGTPHLAHSDPATAYSAVVDNQKVSFSVPHSSRLVRRLATDFHYCWSNCIMDGAEMLAAIEAWGDAVDAGGGDASSVAVDAIGSGSLMLSDGTLDEGATRYTANTIALWEFKEGAGGVAYDSSGVAPATNLELSGTGWLSNYGIDIRTGRAIASRETSVKLYDKIARPGFGTGQYSVEAWVIPANVTQDGPARIVSYSRSTSSRNFTLGQTLYTYDFRNRTTAPEIDENGVPALTTLDTDQDLRDALQHVVITYDQYNGRRIYVDGAFTDDVDGEAPARLWNWDPEHQLVMGNERSGGRPWLGKIRLAAIYNQALTPGQVKQNFLAGVGKRLTMRFDVSEWAGAGSKVEFSVQELDEASYLFCQPTFTSPSSPGLRVKNIRVRVNDEVPVNGQAFTKVDEFVTSPRQQLSRQCSVIAKGLGADEDVFTIVFEELANFRDPVETTDYGVEPSDEVLAAPPILGVRTFARVNESMAALTGVDPLHPIVEETAQQLTEQLPSTQDLRSFVASHQVAITKLATDYCDVMVETPLLRDRFFGASPPVLQNAPVAEAFDTAVEVERITDPLIDRMLLGVFAEEPMRSEVRDDLALLIGDLIATCDETSCDADGIPVVLKGTCTAVLASAAVMVH